MAKLIPNSVLELMRTAARPPARRRSPFQEKYADPLAAVAETVREQLIVLNSNLDIMGASPSFYSMFRIDPTQTRGRPFCDLASGRWDVSELRQLLRDVISYDMIVEAYQLTVDFPILGQGTILLSARQVLSEDGTNAALLIALKV